MKKVACMAVALLMAAVSWAVALAAGGSSEYVIVLPEKPTPVEESAGRELQTYLQRITGAELPIRHGEAGNAPALRVGATPEAAKLLAGKTLATDEIVVQTTGNDLIVTGGLPHGPLYAVNELLARLGVRWWTSRDTFVPEIKELQLPELSIRHIPSFRNRESFYDDVINHPEFASHLRCNGHFEQLGPELGGHDEIIGFCHTFETFLPRREYIAEHPEWFEMFEGVRDPNPDIYGQLCVTNPEVWEALTQVVLQKLREASDPRVISVSQNDNYRYCQCPRCMEIIDAEGSPAGPLLLAVNHVADAVKKEFPGVKVETLAYQYTRKAPKTIRPHDNVVIRLCSIECDFSKPLNSEANASFRDDVLEWAKIAPELAIWNYVTNFTNYLLPHPNLRYLADDIRFFQEHRVVALFEQGDYQSGGIAGDFVAMRAWVLAQLMWDSSQDLNALIDEFLQGYYGAAAPHLRAYLDLLEDEVAKANIQLGCFRKNTADWLTVPTIAAAMREVILADETVKDDPVLSYRVRVVTLPLLLAIMQRYDEMGGTVELASYEELVDLFLAQAREYGVEMPREGGTLEELEKKLRQK